MDILEPIQCTDTKMVKRQRLELLSCAERLSELGLFVLDIRTERLEGIFSICVSA